MIRRAMWLVVIVAGLVSATPAQADHSRSTGINCLDFRFQEDAQAYFEAHPGDPEGLDGPVGPASAGVPGLACEDRPRRGTSQAAALVGYPPGPAERAEGAFVAVGRPKPPPPPVKVAFTGSNFTRWLGLAGGAAVIGVLLLALTRRKT